MSTVLNKFNFTLPLLCRVVCTTNPPVGTLVMDHIQVMLTSGSVANSTSLFSYRVPRFNAAPDPNPFGFQFSPPHGPVSGGTNLSVWGDALDIGSTHRVTVAGLECQITAIW